MYEFHRDRSNYIEWQYYIARDYIIPFLQPATPPLRVLEIGCGEAGVLKAFLERGDTCVGVDLDAAKLDYGREYQAAAVASGRLTLLSADIYDVDTARDLGDPFDLIILKDVIEHIHDQEKFMRRLGDFLRPGGRVFFGFPPWQMPFGGHQQVAENKWAAKLPYYHLLPRPLYRGTLKLAGETEGKIEALLEIKDTGISIERFEATCRRTGWHVDREKFFLFNPIYQYKFGVKTRQQFGLVNKLPWLRNFLTTCAYYVVSR